MDQVLLFDIRDTMRGYQSTIVVFSVLMLVTYTFFVVAKKLVRN